MPQLNSLRAFEAAARLNSISAAADELCVTPAAVAQQVKSLEAWAGNKLFKRNAKGVELTPLGAGVLTDFSEAFDGLAAAVQKLRISANPYEVRIAAMPSIAQLWVSPRLPQIREAMPEVTISVTAMEQMPNLDREPFDLAIFYKDEDAVGEGEVISRDVIFPVCTPEISARLTTVNDLRQETFLHDTAWKSDWENWLSVASPNRNLNKSGPEFSLYSLALEECRNGAGVLIGHEALVRALMDAGDLVAPFDVEVPLLKCLTFETARPAKASAVFQQVIGMLGTGGRGVD